MAKIAKEIKTEMGGKGYSPLMSWCIGITSIGIHIIDK